MSRFDSNPQVSYELDKGLQGIRNDWASLNPQERQDSITQVLNTALTSLGLPPINVVGDLNVEPSGGHYDFTEGEIVISQDLLNQENLSSDDFARLVNVTVHELRHVEQYAIIVQSLYAQGKGKTTAQDLNTDYDIDANFAAAAIKQEIEKPLSTTERDRAQIFYESLLGSGAAQTTQVQKNIQNAIANKEVAKINLKSVEEAISKSPDSVSPDTVRSAAKESNTTYIKEHKARTAFGNLAHERDAFQAEINHQKVVSTIQKKGQDLQSEVEEHFSDEMISPEEFKELSESLEGYKGRAVTTAEAVRFIIDHVDLGMALEFYRASPEGQAARVQGLEVFEAEAAAILEAASQVENPTILEETQSKPVLTGPVHE